LPREAKRRSGGFTLVELMIVLAVLGLAAALALPYFAKGTQQAALGGATQEVRAALNLARSAAIGEDRAVSFSGGIDGYRIDGARHAFAAAAGLVVEIKGGSRIAFYPSGGSSGGHIILRDATARREIEIEALTGRAILLP
jgi:general secretion pathway protein H